MNITLSILWGIFTLIFFLLSFFYMKMMNNRIEHIKVPTTSEIRFGEVAKDIPSFIWDKPMELLQKQVNDFVDKLNNDNKRICMAAACGYLVAALTSGVSLLLTLVN